MKLVDTAWLIDGRIADIVKPISGWNVSLRVLCSTNCKWCRFSDSLKRQRGRRGLEVLQRMQKMPCLEIRVLDDDFAGNSGVDQKLVELAAHRRKIVTTITI